MAYLFAFGVVVCVCNLLRGVGCWGCGLGAKLTGARVPASLCWYGRPARFVAKVGALVKLWARFFGILSANLSRYRGKGSRIKG